MISLIDLSKGIKSNAPKLLRQAHFLESHFVFTKGSWADGARALQAIFPKEARPERPAEWYRLLAGTHWPGDSRMGTHDQIPPGNGPFYVPEWVWEGMSDAEIKEREKALKAGKFRKVWAQVLYLPPTRDYLVNAMRAAGGFLWNADPIMYRGYFYPSLGLKPKATLRDYNVERWHP